MPKGLPSAGLGISLGMAIACGDDQLDELGDRACLGFLHHLGAVRLDRLFADAEAESDTLVGLAEHDEVEHLPFARRQQGEPARDLLAQRMVLGNLEAFLYCLLHERSDERRVGKEW